MNIPESQCDFLIKEKDKPQFIHCHGLRGTNHKHDSPLIGSRSYLTCEQVATEGEWFQA